MLARRRQLSEVGRFAFPWLIDVGRSFKDRGVFPLSLTDYYKERDDIIIAGLVETLIPVGSHHDRIMMDVLSMLGDKPSDIVRKRLFVTMSPPDDDEQWLLLPILSKRDVISMLSWIYDVWSDIENVVLCDLSGDYTGERSLLSIAGHNSKYIQRLRLFVARMTLCDGFGKGLWHNTPVDLLQCPLTDDVLWLLRHFYRLEKVTPDNVNEILQYLGFELPVDFLYSVWGVNEMRKNRRTVIDTFLKNFREHTEINRLVRYCSGTDYYKGVLKKEIPKIEF